MNAVVLGAGRLTIADLAWLAAPGAAFGIAEDAWTRVEAGHALVMREAARGTPMYGLNTGLGGNLTFRVPDAELERFQPQVIRGRMIGVGAALPPNLVRATMAARLVELLTGHAGVSRGAVELLAAMLARDVLPVIPGRGTISAGDLAQLAPIAAVMIGEGEAVVAGERLPGLEALTRAGLAPFTPSPKDGLGLISHDGATIARAALATFRARRLLDRLVEVIGLSFAAYQANQRILDPAFAALRPAAGQVAATAALRAAIEGSAWAPKSLQDAVSFRCAAPALGAAFAALDRAIDETEIELNGVTVTPVALIDRGEVLSTPNFHSASLGQALDGVRISLAHLSNGVFQRLAKLMTHRFSGLPAYLSAIGGGSAGYVSLQKAAAGLHAEIRFLATPVSLDSMAVSDQVEDMASFAGIAAARLDEQLGLMELLVAIEALAAAQGVDLRPPERLGPSLASLHAEIRAAVPTLHEDRPPGADVAAVEAALFPEV